MMKMNSKELRKKNNEREELILEENDEIYTDMIVYLRYADISTYNQELVRADLIEMILDGQERGDNITEVMGDHYKEICDEIIENMPKRTLLEKVAKTADEILCMICSLGVILIVTELIKGLTKKDGNLRFDMTSGYFVTMVIIMLLAELIIMYLKKDLFQEQKDTRTKGAFFRDWIFFTLIYAVVCIPSVVFKQVVFSVSLFIAAIFVVILFGIERLLARIY